MIASTKSLEEIRAAVKADDVVRVHKALDAATEHLKEVEEVR